MIIQRGRGYLMLVGLATGPDFFVSAQTLLNIELRLRINLARLIQHSWSPLNLFLLPNQTSLQKRVTFKGV